MLPRVQHLTHALWSLVLLACASPAATGPETHEVREELAASVDCTPATATDRMTLDIASAALGERRHVEVDLPASYAWATERRYPVLYLLDADERDRYRVANDNARAELGPTAKVVEDMYECIQGADPALSGGPCQRPGPSPCVALAANNMPGRGGGDADG